MKKIFNNPITIFIINIVLSLALCIINVFYQLPAPEWNLTFKFIGSGVFVLLGAINLTYALINKNTNYKFSITIFAGMLLSFGGDVAIEFEFVAGAALFALAHVCYIVAFYFINKFHWLDIVISVAFAIPATLSIGLLDFFIFNPPILKYVVIVYALIISFMFGKSLSCLILKRNFQSIIAFIGAFLFVVSDLCLLIELFSTLEYAVKIDFGHGCMAIYFPALLVFAYSVYYQNKQIL